MGETRFDSLHRPGLVLLADKIADLALAEAKKTGAPILYKTKWDIAQMLHEDVQMVNAALRLAYTSEFFDQYGFGFVPPGNGRSGSIYGYVLMHPNTGATTDALTTLHDGNERRTDHVRGAASHFAFLAKAYGRNTSYGKKCYWLAQQLGAAVATAEQVQEESQKLLP